MNPYNYDRDPYVGKAPATSNEAIEQLAQHISAASFDNARSDAASRAGASVSGAPRGASLAGAPRGASLAGAPRGASLAGAPRGASLAGAPRGASLAGAPRGASLGAPRGASLAGAPRGASLVGVPRGASLAGAARGASLAGAPRGASLAGGPALAGGQKYPLHSRTFNDAIHRAAVAKNVDISNISDVEKENILDELVQESVVSPNTMIPETRQIVEIINEWRSNNKKVAVVPYQNPMQAIDEGEEGVEEIVRGPSFRSAMPNSSGAGLIKQSKITPGFSSKDDKEAKSIIKQMDSLGDHMKTSVEQSKFRYNPETGESQFVSRTLEGSKRGGMKLDDLYVAEKKRNPKTGLLEETTAYSYNKRR